MMLLLLLICVNFPSASFVQLHPVVLVHGYEATRLLYTVDWTVPGSPPLCPPKILNSTLWRSFTNYLDPISSGCWSQCMTMHYDSHSRRSYSAPGVTITTTPFGELDGVEWLAPPGPQRIPEAIYYKNLVDGLVSLGYQRNVNIKAAQYDWRRAPNENTEWFTNTRSLIEQMYLMNGHQPVIIIAHSMGPLFTYILFNRMPIRWREKYIRSWILLSPSFGGSLDAVHHYLQLAYGPPDNLLPVERLALRTFSSSTFLMPRVAAFGNDVLITSSDGKYRAEEYDRFFNQLGYPNALEQWKDVRHLYNPHKLRSPGSFSIYCVVGMGVSTMEAAVYNGPLRPETNFTPIYGDGDGTVNVKSLRLCYRMGQGKSNFGLKEFPRISHDQITKDRGPVEYVVNVVNSINYNAERFTFDFA